MMYFVIIFRKETLMKEKKGLSPKSMAALLLFGMIGQIAWSVENMYFNLFVFEKIAPDLGTVTLMVQASGVVATLVTLLAGSLSDNLGNRRTFISVGYIIWGITVALFGFLSPELVGRLTGVSPEEAIPTALVLAVVCDCVMTLFGSTANDAAFNAWVTDNTESSYRGKIEGILAILPLLAMLVVAGGFGILVGFVGYTNLFLGLGCVITVSGIGGIFLVKDSDRLEKNGRLRDMVYGFKPSTVRENPTLYITFVVIMIYGIACQIFMPYMIIYMTTYLNFTVGEYSVVFGAAILIGAAINLYLTRLSDRCNKGRLLFLAAAIMTVGLFAMYFSKWGNHTFRLVSFGIAGCVMITGYIFVLALTGAIVRDNTPAADAGKLQGIRMIFSVLIPMIIGPFIGNSINKAANIPLPDSSSADVMTTQYIPAPEIFLAACVTMLLVFVFIPALAGKRKKNG